MAAERVPEESLTPPEMDTLAASILQGLCKLTKLERELKLVKDDNELKPSLLEARKKTQHDLIPYLEQAILRSPDDQTMRIVYRRIYGNGPDAFDTEDSSFDRFEMMRESLVRLSEEFGKAWTSPESAGLIPRFVKTYEVDTSLCLKPLDAFTSMNDFFYRAIDIEKHRPMEQESDDGSHLISAMADAHYMVFKPWSMVRGLVVKNKIFNMDTFLGGEDTKFAKNMEGGNVVCVRLHPRHIHRAYSPFDAQVGRIWTGGIAYHTTKPIGIEHPTVDTLGENKRVVMELISPWGTMYAAFVGGPLIGSVQLHVETGSQICRGEEIALFAYGGSAIYMCFPNTFSQVEFSIPANESLDKSEELMLRSTMGRIVLK